VPQAVVDTALHLAVVTALGFLLIRYLRLLVLEAGVLLRHPAARRSWLDQHVVITPQTEVKGRGMSPQTRGQVRPQHPPQTRGGSAAAGTSRLI
jgi:hypothetical protein